MTERAKARLSAKVRVHGYHALLAQVVFTNAEQLATLYTLYSAKGEDVYLYEDKGFVVNNGDIAYIADGLVQTIKWKGLLKKIKKERQNTIIMNEIDRLTK